MILVFIFLIGCFVLSLVAVGLLFALSSVGFGDVYQADKSNRSEESREQQSRGLLQPEASRFRNRK